MTEFQTGSVIAGYTVLGICGRGAYGDVFRVSDSLGAELALKLLPPGKGAERELDALIRFRACRHPNLLTVLHIGELPDGRIFYTMDLADPKEVFPEYSPDTLAARLTGEPFAPEEAERILRELLAGLNELHRARLLHRDIKPANILFIRGRAVLADIGLVADDASASLIGTPDYMPAELLKSHRPMTPADDCYALGLVLYCMLTGEAPDRFPSVPKTLRDPAALRLLKIAEMACTPPGFPAASAFLEQLDRPVFSGKKHGAWKWGIVGGGALLAVLAAFAVWRFAFIPKEPPPSAVSLTKSTALSEKAPPHAVSLTKSTALPEKAPLPRAPAPVVYAPEVAALLKKYQLTEAEKAERERRLAPFRKLEADENARLRQRIAQLGEWTSSQAVEESLKREMEEDRRSRRRFKALLEGSSVPSTAEMEIESLLKEIGSDVPTQSELKRLEIALQRRKEAYSAKNP